MFCDAVASFGIYWDNLLVNEQGFLFVFWFYILQLAYQIYDIFSPAYQSSKYRTHNTKIQLRSLFKFSGHTQFEVRNNMFIPVSWNLLNFENSW